MQIITSHNYVNKQKRRRITGFFIRRSVQKNRITTDFCFMNEKLQKI